MGCPESSLSTPEKFTSRGTAPAVPGTGELAGGADSEETADSMTGLAAPATMARQSPKNSEVPLCFISISLEFLIHRPWIWIFGSGSLADCQARLHLVAVFARLRESDNHPDLFCVSSFSNLLSDSLDGS
jgi:hypothetical protein